jgi:hypothetical protein
MRKTGSPASTAPAACALIPTGNHTAGATRVAFADVNGDGKPDMLVSHYRSQSLGRTSNGVVYVFLQPNGGWPSTIDYNDFHWDGSDSFTINGPADWRDCGMMWDPIENSILVADVRPGDGGKPEILIGCYNNAIYGLFENAGWPASRDLNDLN